MLSNTFMRAPGESVGTFGLECAMDELAEALGIDPIDLRIRNEPERDPDTGEEFSSRNLIACLREGAERFGWQDRVPVREGRLLVLVDGRVSRRRRFRPDRSYRDEAHLPPVRAPYEAVSCLTQFAALAAPAS